MLGKRTFCARSLLATDSAEKNLLIFANRRITATHNFIVSNPLCQHVPFPTFPLSIPEDAPLPFNLETLFQLPKGIAVVKTLATQLYICARLVCQTFISSIPSLTGK